MMECWKKRTTLEKKSFVTLITLLSVLIGLITLILLVTEPEYCKTPSCSESSKRIFNSIDGDKNPCDNFYSFACGKNSSFDSQDSIKFLKSIISETINKNDTKSLKLQKQFYQSCSDLESIDADNDTSFWELITSLGGWPVVSGNNWNESAFDFAEFMVELRDKGLQHDWFLDISVYSNRGSDIILEINAPDNANKIEENSADEYVNLMVNTAMAFGANENVAKSQMPEVMYFETKLTKLIDEIYNENEMLFRREPNQLITIAEIQQKWQNINWLELLNHLTKKKLNDNQPVAFYVSDYMPRLDKLLKQTTKRTQVNYVMWKLVEAYSPYLSARIRDLMDDYSASTNQSDLWYKDRQDFCFEESRTFFQYALEATYLRRHVTENTKRNVEEIIKGIFDQTEDHLRKISWVNEKTRREVISKLQNMSYIIGGPEEMYYPDQFDRDFGVGEIEFNSSNIIDISVIIFHKKLDMLYNKKYDEKNYLKYKFYNMVTSDEVQFYQNLNLLWIPAGAMHGIFYNDDNPNYINYGTAGTTIAYQIVYSLYSRLYRNLLTWPGTSLQNFDDAVKCMKNCTDGVETINCEDDILENISDYLSINLSYQAYQKWVKQNGPEKPLSGMVFTNNQLFWLAYASLMCDPSGPELQNNRIDHMMQSFRVVGPFRSSSYFSKDFKCELDSNMNPRIKCQIP